MARWHFKHRRIGSVEIMDGEPVYTGPDGTVYNVEELKENGYRGVNGFSDTHPASVTIPKLVRAAVAKHKRAERMARYLEKLRLKKKKRGNKTGYFKGIKPGHPHALNSEPGTFEPAYDGQGRLMDGRRLQMWWSSQGWASDKNFHKRHPDLEPGKCACCK